MSGSVVEPKSVAHGAVARLPQLDGLRGLAACGVAFLFHSRALFTDIHFAGEPGLLFWFHQWGWTLVDLFFVISGYIFAHVYLNGHREGRGLTRERLGDFAVARFARLYPLHLVMLCVCAILFFADPRNTLPAFLAHLVMLQAFAGAIGHTFDGPSWSISIEMVCYVLFALGAAGGKRALRWVTIIAILGALLHFSLQGRAGGPWVGDGLPRGLLGFFLGQAMWQMRDRLAKVPTIVLAGLLILGLMIDTGEMSSLLPLILFAWPALLLLALRAPFMGSAPMRWLGDRSYSIYLIHYPVLLVVLGVLGPFKADLPTTVAVVASFAAVILVLSDASYRLLEVPSRRAIGAAWARYRTVGSRAGARAT